MQTEYFQDCSEGRTPCNQRQIITKIEQYKWTKIQGESGSLSFIKKTDLQIDLTYQRKATSHSRILKIARDFNWKSFGVISVIQRMDGTYWIYDGGHRWRATQYRPEIIYIPCIIFLETELEREATAFITTNTMKINVSSADLHNAKIAAKDPLALKVKKLLDDNGYQITGANDTKKTNSFFAIATLTDLMKKHPDKAERVFIACIEISKKEEVITSNVLKAIFTLMQQADTEILTGKYFKKMCSVGISGLEAAIKRHRLIIGKSSPNIDASAIMNLLNKHSSTQRIKMKEDTL